MQPGWEARFKSCGSAFLTARNAYNRAHIAALGEEFKKLAQEAAEEAAKKERNMRRALQASATAVEKIKQECQRLDCCKLKQLLRSAMYILQVSNIDTFAAAVAYYHALHAGMIGIRQAVLPVLAAIREAAVLRCLAEAVPFDKEVYEERLTKKLLNLAAC